MIIKLESNLTLLECESLNAFNLHRIADSRLLVVALTLMTSLVSTFTILANTAVVLALTRVLLSQRKSRGGCNNGAVTGMLMTSTAVSDFLVGCVVMPLSILELANNGAWTFGPTACAVKGALGIVLCTLSIYNVLALALDRYLAVSWPHAYRSLTNLNGALIIASCWIIPVLLISLPVLFGLHRIAVDDAVSCPLKTRHCYMTFTLPYLILSFTVSFYVPIFAMVILYLAIFLKLQKFGKKLPRFKKNQIFPSECSPRTERKIDAKKISKCQNWLHILTISKSAANLGNFLNNLLLRNRMPIFRTNYTENKLVIVKSRHNPQTSPSHEDKISIIVVQQKSNDNLISNRLESSTSVLEDTKCDSNHHQLITSSEAVHVLLIATLTSLTLFTVLANGVILLALARSRLLLQRLRLGPAQGRAKCRHGHAHGGHGFRRSRSGNRGRAADVGRSRRKRSLGAQAGDV
ncbi:Beta-3 adrenergic receptor [Bulinus truncatus]|nr:Beta-3 adrenergic receptor [Bulinus truncatus]